MKKVVVFVLMFVMSLSLVAKNIPAHKKLRAQKENLLRYLLQIEKATLSKLNKASIIIDKKVLEIKKEILQAKRSNNKRKIQKIQKQVSQRKKFLMNEIRNNKLFLNELRKANVEINKLLKKTGDKMEIMINEIEKKVNDIKF